ncbi:MAG: PDZ domain-containing protein [Verrucomicrobiaceae bacterium]|nr:MAG: PDZ domain-containing protein [Verrucomicrobiaceae bacterium]
MKPNLLFPVALAALTAGAGLFTVTRHATAAEQARSRETRPIEFHSYRLELRGDGSSPRLIENGRLVQQNQDDADPMREFFRELRERQRRNGQRDQSGPRGQANPFEELLRQFGELNPDDQDRNDSPDADEDRPGRPPRAGNQTPQEMLEEMMRRMGGPRGAGRLGFGPNTEKDPPRTSKHHLSALAEWRPLIVQARQSTVRVMRRDRQIALATIVSSDGYALTKASEVAKGNFECEFNDGRIVPAKVVDELKSYDLALIKLEANGLTPAKFADTATPVGTLIAAVSTDEDPTGLGVISVASRSLDERTKGFLGVRMSEDTPPKGVRIAEALEGGAAKRAGMEAGDVILAIDGQEIASPRQLQKLVTGLKPEQKVTISIERDSKPRSLELSLGHRSEELIQRQLDQTALMGSNLSQNASGYPNAVQSDLALQAEDAGGPVVDVDGNVVGLNIARAERVSTYLIPGKVINELLTDVQAGKFALAKDADTLQAELSELNASLRKSQDNVKDTESKREEVLKSLERLKKK